MAFVAAGGSRATQDPFVAKLRSSHDQLVRHGGRSLETIWGCDHSPDVLFPLTEHWVTPKGIDPITLKNIENHGKGWPSCSNLGERHRKLMENMERLERPMGCLPYLPFGSGQRIGPARLCKTAADHLRCLCDSFAACPHGVP